MEQAPASRIPKSIGPWTIESQVGSGGMGVVYRANRLDQVCALKVIRPGLLDDLAVQARFEREVEVLRRVRDVHISEFLDADLTREPAWLATAFIDGPTLRQHVKRNGPLPEAAWWRLARGLAQALAVLEVHGITHRDMKPANVIMAAHGPVLIDFGIAVPEDAQSLTGTGLVTGSPAWLSPEQANLQPISTASDVFSLGSLLTFAGTGRTPFGQGANVAVLMAITSNEPDTAGLTAEQQAFLHYLMAKNPTERPAAREVLAMTKQRGVVLPPVPAPVADSEDATQVMAAGPATAPQPVVAEPVAAQPTPAPGRTEEEPKRGIGLLLLLVLGLAAVLAGLVFFLTSGGDGTSEPGPSPSATPQPTLTAPPPGQSVGTGDFVLNGWSIENAADGTMSVATTVVNNGTEDYAGFATITIFSDGVAIGTATGQLPEIEAGGSADVTLDGDDQWQPGEKSVVLDVQ